MRRPHQCGSAAPDARFRRFAAARKLTRDKAVYRWALFAIGRLGPESQGRHKVTGTQAQGSRILVVDDNDDNRYTLTLYLDLEGYHNVEVAEDGEAAIARLEREAFDLVLLDVLMPKVDGYQVLTWLKGKDR